LKETIADLQKQLSQAQSNTSLITEQIFQPFHNYSQKAFSTPCTAAGIGSCPTSFFFPNIEAEDCLLRLVGPKWNRKQAKLEEA